MPFDFANMTPPEIGVQIVGFVAMAFGIGSYQPKRRVFILLMQLMSSALFSTQFALLIAMGPTAPWTGLILNLIAVPRALIYAMKEKWSWVKQLWLPFVMSAAFITAGILTFGGPLSLLPMAAMVLSSFALYLSDERKIRILSLFVSPLWLVYDFMANSLAGALNEAFIIVSIVIALIRYRQKKTPAE